MKIKRWITLTITVVGLCVLSQTAHAQDKPRRINQRTPDIGQVAERFQRPSTITITGTDIGTLSDKLQEFRNGLSRGEQAVMDQMLRRAAAAPANDPEGIDVKRAPVFMPGRHTISGGGVVDPSPLDAIRAAAGIGTADIGPKQDDPRSPPTPPDKGLDAGTSDSHGERKFVKLPSTVPTDSARPKPTNDPHAVNESSGVNAADVQSFTNKLQGFGGQLTPAERAGMDWLVQRAASAPKTPEGVPGGLPPALHAALGIVIQGGRTADIRLKLRY